MFHWDQGIHHGGMLEVTWVQHLMPWRVFLTSVALDLHAFVKFSLSLDFYALSADALTNKSKELGQVSL
jgi:hypothetical protein